MSALAVEQRGQKQAQKGSTKASGHSRALISLLSGVGLVVGAVLLANTVFALLSPGFPNESTTAIHPEQTMISVESVAYDSMPFGDCPPETDAERELEAMLHGPDEEIDLALANYLVAVDLPQFHNLTRDVYFDRLDQATAFVQDLIDQARADSRIAGSLDDPANLSFVFASGVIGLGIDYREEFQRVELTPAECRALYLDANNLFAVGLLRTGRGSCVSMPMLYLLIGDRLGLPVHLASVGKHCFLRWEEPGYRMNFETTIVQSVSMTPDDDVFLEIEGLTRADIAGTDDLRNLTRREIIGGYLFTRACHLFVHGPEHIDATVRDAHRAAHLMPNNRNVRAFLSSVLERQSELQRLQTDVTDIAVMNRLLNNPRRQSFPLGPAGATQIQDPLADTQSGSPQILPQRPPTPGRNMP